MSKQPRFIPGRPHPTKPPLAPYRPHQPAGAARDYVRTLTDPGALVVDLFCQGPRFVREALTAGRRVLGFSVNPVLLHAARLGLNFPDEQALSAGFTHLMDRLKGDTPLGRHLASLYRSRCPVCRSASMAEWFAWRHDSDRPFEKGVRCQECGGLQVGATDADDVALAQSFGRRGLAYYYALNRAAALDDPVRERAAELVDCYTPRNLSALMDVARRIEDVELARDVRIALVALLLDCFDRCSKLHPYGEGRTRPRTLRVPVRYLERNVLLCFEEGLSLLKQGRSSPSVPETENVSKLAECTRTGYALIACPASHVGEVLPERSVDLVLVDPPRPDGVFWALSALWAAWVWRGADVQAMRPFLRRRRFDWRWHWQAFRAALSAVESRLTEDGLVVTLFSAPDHAMVESVCLAAINAGYHLCTWGQAPEIGYRLVWRPDQDHRPRAAALETVQEDAVHEIQEAATSTLQQRGEPSSDATLHAAAMARLTEQGFMQSIGALGDDVSPSTVLADVVARGLDAAPIEVLAEDTRHVGKLWWLLHPHDTADPLADRVEVLVRELLAERLVWLESDLINEVYARFSGPLTPDLTLVRVCVASYGVREGQEVRLRSEDDFDRRRREIYTVREDLATLGNKMGFRASSCDLWDVSWLKDERQAYGFIVSATGTLASYVLGTRVPDVETKSCLVVPGGRAALIDLKLRRDPRLVRAVDSGRWQFIKFRHLRRLVAEEDLRGRAFEIVLGLDPIAEREHTQLSLL